MFFLSDVEVENSTFNFNLIWFNLEGLDKRSAPQIDSGSTKSSATATKQQMEELKILRDALVANFRWDLPENVLVSEREDFIS